MKWNSANAASANSVETRQCRWEIFKNGWCWSNKSSRAGVFASETARLARAVNFESFRAGESPATFFAKFSHGEGESSLGSMKLEKPQRDLPSWAGAIIAESDESALPRNCRYHVTSQNDLTIRDPRMDHVMGRGARSPFYAILIATRLPRLDDAMRRGWRGPWWHSRRLRISGRRNPVVACDGGVVSRAWINPLSPLPRHPLSTASLCVLAPYVPLRGNDAHIVRVQSHGGNIENSSSASGGR